MTSERKEKLLVFFDYEGTLATSIRRHYVQYGEALESVGASLKLGNESGLTPVSWDEFERRYRDISGIEDYLPVSAETLEGRIARALFRKTYSEILWKYRPEHLLLEQLLPNCIESIKLLSSSVRPVMISYTRQDNSDFIQHLSRLGLVGENCFLPSDILCVGADGKNSRDAKREAMQTVFADALEDQKKAERFPLYVGDSVDDFLAATDAGVGFVAVTETGKGHADDFLRAAEQSRAHGALPSLNLFTRLSDDQCLNFILRQSATSPT